MSYSINIRKLALIAVLSFSFLYVFPLLAATSEHGHDSTPALIPRSVDSYGDSHIESVSAVLKNRVEKEPFNLVATLLFLGAIIHTFMAGKFRSIAHHYDEEYKHKMKQKHEGGHFGRYIDQPAITSFKGKLFHFLGEIEAVFGIWCVPLLIIITLFYGGDAVFDYLDGVNFTEPLFVVVIMTIASTRPVVRFAESFLHKFASIGGASIAAWWLSILMIAPLLGSFITEPGAMTIGALLLAKQFYYYRPSETLKYATISLLFVNVSVGGTLTHFAAPPVVMVAGKWDWTMGYMFTHFGWKAVLGIVVSTLIYFVIFRKEFVRLTKETPEEKAADAHGVVGYWADRNLPIPHWITTTHLLFVAWTVFTLHHPVFFIGGFLFFLAFTEATMTHQNPVQLRSSLMVGFFLGGIVIFGSLQQWWLGPVLAHLGEVPLFIGATILTAFNDNAAITFLASQVPLLDPKLTTDPLLAETLRYAVVAGAVTGGGLTVIANAPNPAGQSILSKYFENGVSPLWLAIWAIPPTIIVALFFMLMK